MILLLYTQFFDTYDKIKKNFYFLRSGFQIYWAKNIEELYNYLEYNNHSILLIENNNLNESREIVSKAKTNLQNTLIIFVIEQFDNIIVEELINLGVKEVILKDEFWSSNLTKVILKAIRKNRMKKGKEALNVIIEKAQRFWLTVFDNIPEYTFIIDIGGYIVRCNKTFSNLFNKHPREIIGKKAYELMPLNILKEIRHNGNNDYFEEELNGIVYSITASSFEFDDEKYIVFFMRDITEVKRMREHIFQKEKYTSIGILASGIAHEINNPLTGIVGFTQMLKMVSGCGDKTEMLDKILECADRCKKIVESLLIYSRQRPASKSLESINNVLERTIDLVGYNLKKNNIVIEKTLGNVPVMFIDGQQLQQALINIILNAEEAIISAGRNKGEIKIQTSFDDNLKKTYIKISDNGTGIKEEVLNKIFDPFFTTKTFGEAMGLGLSIALGVIKEHRGNIHVETKLDVGTTFVIELPIE